jgi:hypothetical protein
MKANTLILLICIIVTACSKKELTKDEAMVLLTKEKGYPRTMDFEVFTADPVHAKRLLDANLENEGYVTIKKTQKLGEIGNPLISFTEKAKSFLLPVTAEDEKISVQKVRIADENVVEVKSIVKDNHTGAVEVRYVTNLTNATPFSVLIKNIDKPKELLATFKNDGEKWILVRNR